MFKVSTKITPLGETSMDDIIPEQLKEDQYVERRISGQKVSWDLEEDMKLAQIWSNFSEKVCSSPGCTGLEGISWREPGHGP